MLELKTALIKAAEQCDIQPEFVNKGDHCAEVVIDPWAQRGLRTERHPPRTGE